MAFDGGGSLSELYSSFNGLSLKIRDALERLEHLEYTSSSSSSLSLSDAVVSGSSDDQATSIRTDLNQIQFLCTEMDRQCSSTASEQQRDLWKGKVEQVSKEAELFRDSLDKYMSRHQKRIQEAQERAELLGRANDDTHVLRIFDEEEQPMVRRSSRLLEDSFAIGVAIFSKYSEQRDHLKSRVVDMAFFAEDVHLLASASSDGWIIVCDIGEGPNEQDNPQITAKGVVAVQFTGGEGESEYAHPRVCWHCHKREVLVVGIGNNVLKIDITKVERDSEGEPLSCSFDKLIDGVQLVGSHDGQVTDLSMCHSMTTTRLVSASVDGTIKIWEDQKSLPIAVLRPYDGQPVNSVTFVPAPDRPDHIILITGGPLNREVKIWVSASDEGWLLPSDAESWKCTQTLEFKSSMGRSDEAFFNQLIALSQAGLLLLANAKRNAIYAVHLEYGPNPAATRMDYIAEFTVTTPILSFSGTSELLLREQIVKVYCVQTQAIQQYALDLSQCLPSLMQEILKLQLVTMQEMQKLMATMVVDAITKEGEILEATLGRSMEKAAKAIADALWARFQEENTKQEKAAEERTHQLTNMISNRLNKDLPAIIEKTVKRGMTAVVQSVAQTIAPAIEKTITTSIVENFQKGVGDQAVNKLEKSVNSKLEATVVSQIQAQFQTSGKQALQETFKSNLEASLIPAFEMSCKAMFEQIDATFQEGMIVHNAEAQQQFEGSLLPLALDLKEAVNSSLLATQRELLAKMVGEGKYEEAFNAALRLYDVATVSWLCSQVILPTLLSKNPPPLSQSVLLSLLSHLTLDINKETPQKLIWIRAVLSTIYARDPTIVVHGRPLFELLYQVLDRYSSLPTISSPERDNIILMMNVLHFMLATWTE